jgi:hypothetical protein
MKSKKVGKAATGEHISGRAMQHCTVAQSVRIGQRAVTNDGHVVERASVSEWLVVAPTANDTRYGVGAMVRGGTLFWRMNGLGRRVDNKAAA